MNTFQIKSSSGLFWNYSGSLVFTSSNTFLFKYIKSNILTEDNKYLCYNEKFYYDKEPLDDHNYSIIDNKIMLNDKYICIEDMGINLNVFPEDWEFIYPDYYIVATPPYSFSWNLKAECDNDSMYTFSIRDVIKSDNKYLCYSCSANKLYFSEDNKEVLKIELIPCEVLHNYFIKTAGINKYIRHYASKLRLDPFEDSYIYKKDSMWFIPPNLIDKTHDVVVARYNEDIRWTRFIPANIIIYNKNIKKIQINKENIKVENLPNVGREGHTYLHHIITNYNNLAEFTTFIQGAPLPHGNDIYNLLCMKKYYTPVQSISSWYSYKPNEVGLYEESKVLLCGAQSSRFMYNADYIYLPRLSHQYSFFKVTDVKIPLNKFKNDCNIIKKNNNFVFISSGILSVSKERIQDNSCAFYENIIKVLLSNNNQGGREGYALEFFWPTIFGE